MGTKIKITLAASFVGVVLTAAAAFGQAGAPDSGDEQSSPRERRRAAAEQRDPDACGPIRPRPRLGRLVHSESKVQTREGFATIILDHGEVTAVDHGDKTLTIKRADGESVRGTATEDTKVCKDGKAAFDSIKTGDAARLVHARSSERNGLIRIYVRTPGSEPEASPERPERTRPEESTARFAPGDIFDMTAEFAI